MDLTVDDLDEMFEENVSSEIYQKLSLTAPQPATFNLKDLDREVFQFDEDSDTDRVKSSNCSVWSQDVDDWGDLEIPQNSSITLGGIRNLEGLSEMNEDDDMGLVIPDTDRPFDFSFTKSLKPAYSRDLMSESELGFESENELGSNIETLRSPAKSPGFGSESKQHQAPSSVSKAASRKPMLITMDMMPGLLTKKAEPPVAAPKPKSISERLSLLTARLSRPKHQAPPSPAPIPQNPKTDSFLKSRPASSLSRTSTRPSTAMSQGPSSTVPSPRPTRLPERFSSGSQRDSKRPPTHRVAFGRTLKGILQLTPETPTPKPKPRKPTLIKSIAPETPTGTLQLTAVIGQMKYDPIAKRWLGNDAALTAFDPKPTLRPTLIPHSTYTPAPHSMTFDPVSCKWLGNDSDDIFADIPSLPIPLTPSHSLRCDKSDRDGFTRSETRHKLWMGTWYPKALDKWSRDTSRIHLYEIRMVI